MQESAIFLLPTSSRSPRAKSPLYIREPIEEELITISASPSLGSSHSIHISTTSNNSAPNVPLGTFLPACFSSYDSCTNTTNYCSGHGSCYAKHAGCFACKCGSTVVRYNEDGSYKTVQWGGAACEKKDVSVPFFLFASLGIALATLVASSIGMLLGMGSEDLPSVLGAGVAGPTARK